MNNEYPQSLLYSVLVLQSCYNRHLFKDHCSRLLGDPKFWAKADAKVLLFFELTKYF